MIGARRESRAPGMRGICNNIGPGIKLSISSLTPNVISARSLSLFGVGEVEGRGLVCVCVREVGKLKRVDEAYCKVDV